RRARFLAITLAFVCAAIPRPGASAPPAAPPRSTEPQISTSIDVDLPARLAAIEKALEAQRQEHHVPGAALVIVKDDRVIFVTGFGVRDVEGKLPVTPATLFAIGSTTKAFTALAVMMSADEGKLSLW